MQLGDDLNPEPAQPVGALAVGSPLHAAAQPTVALSTPSVTRGFVLIGDRFKPLGAPLPSPSSALYVSGRREIYACTADTYLGGPFVHRWDGSRWSPVGGDVSVETGLERPPPRRYSVQGCGSVVLDGEVPVVAWSAQTGVKHHTAFVARWSAQRSRWELMEPGIPGRNTQVTLAVDEAGPLCAVTFSPGGSYGGGNTTLVSCWSNGGWSPLGSGLPDTDSPQLAVRSHAPYLALRQARGASEAIQILRWHDGAWLSLPSPGSGSARALTLSPAGRPIVAFTDHPTNQAPPVRLRVRYLADRAWHDLGSRVADVSQPDLQVALDLDARERPLVLFSNPVQQGNEQRYEVRLARYGGSIP